MVIDKTTKQLVYPIGHRWTVNNNKTVANYIKQQLFFIGVAKQSSQIGVNFKGYQLSKSTTNNVVITIINCTTNQIIGTIRATVDDINKTFVHAFNKQLTIDNDLNRASKIALIRFALRKPVATTNQILAFLKTVKHKSTTAIDGLSNAEIANCVKTANQIIKTLKIVPTNYTIDDKLVDFYKMNNVDILLEATSYRSKADQFNYDKKLISDRRYTQPNNNKIINTILNYRLTNKQIIPIRLSQTNNDPYVWNPSTKTIVRDRFKKDDDFKVQSINWSTTLTEATINLSNHFAIVVNKDVVIIKHKQTTNQYRLSSFKSFLTTDSTVNWPSTFKNDTTRVKTILINLSTINQINGTVRTVDQFETVYQELSETQQTDSAAVFRIVQRIFDTFAVDNIAILCYYLINKQTNTVSFDIVIV